MLHLANVNVRISSTKRIWHMASTYLAWNNS